MSGSSEAVRGLQVRRKTGAVVVYADGGKTIYCEAPFDSSISHKTAGGLQMSIEHALPKSKITAALGQGVALDPEGQRGPRKLRSERRCAW